jgi:hypothetical protein
MTTLADEPTNVENLRLTMARKGPVPVGVINPPK